MSDSKQPAPIQRVMVVTAHPDDSEFGAGGTVAKLVQEGKQVVYCVVTNGNKGSGDRSMTPERLARIREEEQRNAARVLGVETVEFLGFPDCEVENTRESRLAVTAVIRRHRPDRLIIQNPHRTVTTARWRGSRSTASTPSPATTWRSLSCSPRASSPTRSARST